MAKILFEQLTHFPHNMCFQGHTNCSGTKIGSNLWRHVEKGKKDHRVRAMFNTQYVTSCGWMGMIHFVNVIGRIPQVGWLTMHYTLLVVTPHWLIGMKICEI